jgi:hypothetical protein
MPISSCVLTVDNPIPTWKGPVENGIPDILILQEDAPGIPGIIEEDIPFHCATTVARDGGISDPEEFPEVVKFEKVEGTKYDDQS